MTAPAPRARVDATQSKRGWPLVGALLLVPLLGCPRDYLPGTNVIVTVELERGDELGEIYRDELQVIVQVNHLASYPEKCESRYDEVTLEFLETELEVENTVPAEPGWVCGYAFGEARASGVHVDGDAHPDWIDCGEISAPLSVELDEEADLTIVMDCEIFEDTEVPD